MEHSSYFSTLSNPYEEFKMNKKLAKKERKYMKDIEYHQRKTEKYLLKYKLFTGIKYSKGQCVYDYPMFPNPKNTKIDEKDKKIEKKGDILN